MSQKRHRRAFTLVEVILVVVIIAMLAGIVLTRLHGHSEKARIAAAKAQISSIKTALGSFEMDCGRFPTTSEGLIALVVKPSDLTPAAKWQPYMEESKIPSDPWGWEYLYRCPGSENTTGYDLLSPGPDGEEGTEDDIGNTVK